MVAVSNSRTLSYSAAFSSVEYEAADSRVLIEVGSGSLSSVSSNFDSSKRSYFSLCILEIDADRNTVSSIKVLVSADRSEIGSSGLFNALTISALRDCITERTIFNKCKQYFRVIVVTTLQGRVCFWGSAWWIASARLTDLIRLLRATPRSPLLNVL